MYPRLKWIEAQPDPLDTSAYENLLVRTIRSRCKVIDQPNSRIDETSAL